MSSPPASDHGSARDVQSGSARPQSGQRKSRTPLRFSKRLSRGLGDWFGIAILFQLWIVMLILVAHSVIIPRTCTQAWPRAIPLLGGIKSVLEGSHGPRAACLAQASTDPAVIMLPTLPKLTMADTMTTYILPDDALILATTLWAVAAMPLLLSFGAALISKWQQSPRARHRFVAEQERTGAAWTARERIWKTEAAEGISKHWLIESRHAAQAQHRMMQHACLYGFATSAILAWGILSNNSDELTCQTRMMAVTAASAAFTSFSLSFGRLTVRASIRDTSARMFAYALRALILSVVAAILMIALLWHHSQAPAPVTTDGVAAVKDAAILAAQPFKGPTSFMMLGMVVALIGEGVLSQITARAASAMSISTTARSSEGAKELAAIDGLTEHDIVRLGEEGIDSVHALAMASTASLYFATPYTLQRLVDWQDQALLITYVGLAKAQMCREKLMVRGACDLQRKADFLMSQATDGTPDANATRDKTFEIIRSSLGFVSIEQARESLFPIAHDGVIRRLRVFHRGAVSEDIRA